MSGSKARVPCGWHQRKQARRRGTNVKEEARFYVEWIDPAARSTLTAAHSPCTHPPRGILRLYRDVITYATSTTVQSARIRHGCFLPRTSRRKRVENTTVFYLFAGFDGIQRDTGKFEEPIMESL